MDRNENKMENTPVRTEQDVPSPEINLCINACGFFGSPQTGNMCSKCYRETIEKAKNTNTDKQTSASETCVDNLDVPSVVDTVGETVQAMEDVAMSSTAVASTAAPVVMEEEVIEPEKLIQTKKNRCWDCNKKVGLLGHECRCGYIFCAGHRYAEDHNCSFDFKEEGRKHLAEQNPHVSAPKIQKI